jgi:hypothetical protein
MSSPNPIQLRIKTQLLLNPYFSDALVVTPNPVPIITADDGDIEGEIERQVSIYTGGMAITILIPFGSQIDPKVPRTQLQNIIEVSASEETVINRSATGFQKKAYDAIRKIMAPWKSNGLGGLHHWEPAGGWGRFELKDFGEFGAKTKSGKTLLLYRALFEATETIT